MNTGQHVSYIREKDSAKKSDGVAHDLLTMYLYLFINDNNNKQAQIFDYFEHFEFQENVKP